MTTLLRMIPSSFPTRGYEDEPGGSEPIEFAREAWRTNANAEILRRLERRIERFGLCALEPITKDDLVAYARAVEELRREEGRAPIPHIAQLQEAELLARLHAHHDNI